MPDDESTVSDELDKAPAGPPKTPEAPGPDNSAPPAAAGPAGGIERWARWGVYIAAAGLVVALLTWTLPINQPDLSPPAPPATSDSAVTLSPSTVAEQLFQAAKAGNFTEISTYLCQQKRGGFFAPGDSFYRSWEELQQVLNKPETQPLWRVADEKINGRDASLKVYISVLDQAGQRQEVPEPMQFGLVDEQGWKVCDVYTPG